VASRPNHLLVIPGMALGSSRTHGIRRNQPTSTVGPEAYPPILKITSGENSRTIRHATPTARHAAQSACAMPPQFRPRNCSAGIKRKANPKGGIISFSMPCCVPTNKTSAPNSRRATSATATPGNRCPPVPPAARSMRISLGINLILPPTLTRKAQ
jgi:hypothetical protein